MSFDKAHIGILAILFTVGLANMLYTIPRVRSIRRYKYFIAVPMFVALVVLYVHAFLMYPSGESLATSWQGLTLRYVLGCVAVEGLLIPYVDRLDAQRDDPPEVQIVVEDNK